MDNTNKAVLMTASATTPRWKQLAKFSQTGENNFRLDNMLFLSGSSTAALVFLEQLASAPPGTDPEENTLLHTYRTILGSFM